MYNFLKNTIFPFQTDKVLKESLHMFDTKKRINEKCDSIRCSKKKTMAHSMSLNNRISYVVGISIFRFKTYWKRVFALMEIQTTSTFEKFFQEETINTKKNKSYYQRYYVKQLIAFHQQSMTKQQIYNNMLARRSGMEYIQGIQFQTSLINMEEAQELTMNNQPKNNRSGDGVAPTSTYGFPPRIDLWDLQLERPKNRPRRCRFLNPKQRRQQKMQQQRKRSNV